MSKHTDHVSLPIYFQILFHFRYHKLMSKVKIAGESFSLNTKRLTSWEEKDQSHREKKIDLFTSWTSLLSFLAKIHTLAKFKYC